MQREINVELMDLVKKTEILIKNNISSSDIVRKLIGFKRDLMCHYYRGLSSHETMDELISLFDEFKIKRT